MEELFDPKINLEAGTWYLRRAVQHWENQVDPIPFALAETGERLQKDLGDQRRYLRDYFDKLPSMDEKRGVVASLANLSAQVEGPHVPHSSPFDSRRNRQ